MRDNKPIIRSLKLRNFKCHSSFMESLNCMTILAGENSAGKSSLIQAILLFDKTAKTTDTTIFTLNVYGINLGLTSGILSENMGSNEMFISLNVLGNDEYVRLFISENNDVSFDISEKKTSKQVINLFYINAERLGPRAFNSISSDDSFNVGTHGENTIYVIEQISTLFRKEYLGNDTMKEWKELTDEKLAGFSAIVEHCLQQIIPGTRMNVNMNTELGTTSVRYSNGIGNEVIPTATGFGITYVLPIIVQALASFLVPNSVLIIENPEAHLHPYSQSKLGHFLAKISSYGIQIILETHSEHIINGIRLELASLHKNNIANIIFFERDLDNMESKHTVISIDEAGELSAWPTGFFDQNERDLYEVVKNKCKL